MNDNITRHTFIKRTKAISSCEEKKEIQIYGFINDEYNFFISGDDDVSFIHFFLLFFQLIVARETTEKCSNYARVEFFNSSSSYEDFLKIRQILMLKIN